MKFLQSFQSDDLQAADRMSREVSPQVGGLLRGHDLKFALGHDGLSDPRRVDRLLGEYACSVVLLSPNYFEDEWTAGELRALLAYERRLQRDTAGGEFVIPVLTHDVPERQIPETLHERGIIDLRGAAWADGIAALAARVRRAAPSRPPRVFVVHGRDESAKSRVARLLGLLGFEPVVLHEQEDGGRTIIEKLERHLNVAFAVVLLTPDDVGGLAEHRRRPSELRPRARQNVVFELGLFIGVLGRDRVRVLRVGDVEEVSDISGVIAIRMDGESGWATKLAKEMQLQGLPVDFEKLSGFV